MAEITKPIILDDTGKSIATANARTAAALESIAQILADGDGGGGEGGGSGADGFSPIVTVTDITGGHRISIRDAVGTKTFDVLDGATGPQGQKGDTGATGSAGATGPAGADGFSPTLAVTTITGGHRVTITDADGSRYFDVMDGSGSGGGSGHDGFSPIVTVTDITGGHRVSIQDATSTKTFDVMDGAAGAKGDTGSTGPQGPKGDKGDTGPAGSDATVTSANIASALGYTPANPADIPVVTNDFTNAYKDKVDTLWGDYQSAIVALG